MSGAQNNPALNHAAAVLVRSLEQWAGRKQVVILLLLASGLFTGAVATLLWRRARGSFGLDANGQRSISWETCRQRTAGEKGYQDEQTRLL